MSLTGAEAVALHLAAAQDRVLTLAGITPTYVPRHAYRGFRRGALHKQIAVWVEMDRTMRYPVGRHRAPESDGAA